MTLNTFGALLCRRNALTIADGSCAFSAAAMAGGPGRAAAAVTAETCTIAEVDFPE